MGVFWDLLQQSQISDHRDRAESLEARVARLEEENDRLATFLREVIGRLEKHVGVDLDKDGKIG